jgi:Chloroplast envelope transporter
VVPGDGAALSDPDTSVETFPCRRCGEPLRFGVRRCTRCGVADPTILGRGPIAPGGPPVPPPSPVGVGTLLRRLFRGPPSPPPAPLVPTGPPSAPAPPAAEPAAVIPDVVPYRRRKFIPGDRDMDRETRSRHNAVIAMNNAIAEKGSARKLPPYTLAAVARALNLFMSDLGEERKALYARYVEHALDKGTVTAETGAELKQLARQLELDAGTVRRIRREAGPRVYRRRLREALKDGRVDAAEQATLARLRTDLELRPEDAGKIQQEALAERLAPPPAPPEPPERPLTPDEQREAVSLAAKLGAEVPPERCTPALLKRLHDVERARSKPLPELTREEFPLHQGEVAHATRHAALHALPPVNRWECGPDRWNLRPSLSPQVYVDGPWEREPALPSPERPLARGRTVLTSERLVLPDGASLPLVDLTHVSPYAGGVELRSLGGAVVFLAFRDHVATFVAQLERAVDARHAP